MMNANQLLCHFQEKLITLYVVDGNLKCKAPKGVMTPELVENLRERKQEIMALLDSAAQRERMLPRPSGVVVEASFAQQRLWFLDQLERDSPFYNMPQAVRLSGALDVAVLRQVINDIVRRHEALRTAFATVDGVPVQTIAPVLELAFPLTDLCALPHAEREVRARALAQDEAQMPFDLASGPLIRASLLRMAEHEHIVLFTLHHIVSDGWSIGVLINEVATLYGAYAQGLPSPLPDLALQYADFAHWQRRWLSGAVLQQQLDYWTRQLAGAPALLALPTDRARPAIQGYRGAALHFEVGAATVAGLHALGRQTQSTLFMVLAAAFNALLARYSGQSDICIGTPIANRNRAETEALIGFFANTLVLRSRIDVDAPFIALLRQVRGTALDAYAHQDVPFEQLVELLKPERDPSRSPLFQVLLTLQNTPAGALELPGLKLELVTTDEINAKFDLSLDVTEGGGQLWCSFNYNSDLFDSATIARLSAHFQRLLDAVARDPDCLIGELALLDRDERRRLLVDWNDTAAPYPAGQGLQQLFEAQAAATPAAVALECGAAALSYGELNARANQLAHHLRGLGVGPDALVGICVERSPEMVVGLLGVLKAGGAYVALDPAYPQARLAYMLADAAPAVLLTQQRLRALLPAGAAPVLCLDSGWDAVAGQPDGNPEAAAGPDNLAYVIYTSGSTGKPKGSGLSLAALHNLIAWQLQSNAADGAAGPGRVLQFASLNFDVSFQEIYSTLCGGDTLVLLDDAQRRDMELLRDVICGARLRRIFLPNAVLQQLAQLALPQPPEAPEQQQRCCDIVSAGEQLQMTASLAALVRALGGRYLFNQYGPSETHVASQHRLDCAQMAQWPTLPPIGRPIANTQLHVLDARLRPVPVGVTGELYIAGAGLARGYLGRAGLTAEKFVPNPYGAPGARMYKSGDLARYLASGEIEYLGRSDEQVKVRGFRIEPGEIEAVLAAVPGVAEAILLVREDTVGDKRLVAYVVAAAGVDLGEGAGLRAALARSLPDYMIPASFVMLERLPLTPNGKVDRRALPAPDMRRGADGYVAPRTVDEEILASIWAEVLRLERVGVHDNFFALGGHSLLATQVMSRLRVAFQVEMPLRMLFTEPTVAGLVRSIDEARRAGGAAVPALVPAERGGSLDLSYAQQRLWFLDQLEPFNAAYNLPDAIRFTGRLEIEALRATLSEIMRRHEVLRTSFSVHEGSPVQVIAPAGELPLPLTDLCHLPPAEREARARWLAQDEAQTTFDLAAGPLIRAGLIRLGADEHIVLFTLHHIVADGWSMGVLVNEVAALYGAYTQGLPSPLPELALQYADFAHWQRQWLSGAVLEQKIDYWRSQLADAPTLLALPTDRARPAMQSHRGAALSFEIGAATTAGLQTLGRQNRCTLFMVLAAAFNALLARYTGQSDICIGTPIANRNRAETEALIGFFINTLVLRSRVDTDAPFSALLEQMRATALDAYAHQDVPFEQLVEALNPERHTSHSPLFQVMLTLQNAPVGALELAGLKLESMTSVEVTAKFDLSLDVTEGGGQLWCSFEYNTDLFDEATIARLARHFARLLDAVAADPSCAIGELPLLAQDERRQLLVEWNGAAAPYPSTHTIGQLFEAQVARSADAVALVYEGESLSYGELNRQANRLAHYLRGLGVGPEVLVGLCVERSPQMIVAVLGILKAGGAYVPLDPSHPRERLAYMLDDARPALVLTQQHLLATLPNAVASICLDDGGAIWNRQDSDSSNPVRLSGVSDLAYVLYTSGSTGRPKGVMIEQRPLVNLASSQAEKLRSAGCRSVLQFASLNFDMSVEEIFPALLAGAQLVLRPPMMLAPDREFLDLIRRCDVDALNLPVAFWHEWVAQLQAGHSEVPECLRLVSVGGEKVNAERYRHWAQHTRHRKGNWINAYGPTESTVNASYFERAFGALCDGADVPIGRPAANTRLYVLDARLQPVPVGVAGELYIGGEGLARGYLGRPDLSADKFMPDPFGVAGTRMYKSGDLVRHMSDGNLEYLGRGDDQVKIRGFRIELGEIEAALAAVPGVAEAVLLVREDTVGDKRLVAYVVAEPGVAMGEGAGLRAALARSLPDYMIPASFVALDRLPLTPNGKVDRRALPVPDMSATQVQYVAPRTEIERVLCEIWQELLDLKRVGITDNFFALGGHSLLAVSVVSLVRQRLALDIPVRALFVSSSVETLAAVIDARTATARFSNLIPIRPAGPDSAAPLFLVHPGEGEVGYARDLAPWIDAGVPIYALAAMGFLDGEAVLRTVPEMAMTYILAMREVQPYGPYRVAGWSAGGTIAYEIARQLIAAGQVVEFLGLIDTVRDYGAWGDAPGVFRGAHADADDALVMLADMPGDLTDSLVGSLRALAASGDVSAMFDLCRSAGILPPRADNQTLRRHMAVRAAILRALHAYVPRALPIPMLLLTADQEQRSDCTLGWRALMGDQLDWIGVQGNHYSIMDRPNIERVGEVLSNALSRECVVRRKQASG